MWLQCDLSNLCKLWRSCHIQCTGTWRLQLRLWSSKERTEPSCQWLKVNMLRFGSYKRGAGIYTEILDIRLNMTYLDIAALVLNVVLYGDVGS